MAYTTPQLLSDRGRAWLGSVEGVPPQQLPAHAEMAAKTGLMPFQDALMIKQMADQIRASGSNQPPPPNNVMAEKLALISGRAPVPQMPPPPQMEGPAAPPQQDPRMQGGLGAMPAPVMDNAKFAGGGIVAFGEGGSTTKYPPEFLKVIGPLLDREGGSKTTKIEGDRGGLTRFGISKVNNPDIDVANLTKEKAIEIYYERYWKKSGADKVYANDPYAAEVLMDTAVHSGPDTAVSIFREAAGNPSKMLDIRQQRLDQQAKAESQKKFKAGWDNRIASLREGAPHVENTEGTATGAINRTPPPAATGTVSGTIDRGNVLVPPVLARAPAPAGLPAAAMTPEQQRQLQAENDRRAIARGISYVNQGPALIGDILGAGQYNRIAGGLESAANAIGIPRAGRALGIYGNDVTRVTIPKIGDGSAFPYSHAMDQVAANNQPSNKLLPPEKAPPATPKPPPAAKTTSPAPAAPTVEEIPEKPLLERINVDEEMKKRGMTDEERYLAHARAGFAAAAQRGKFSDKFATFGGTLAEGLGNLKASDRKQRTALEEEARKRDETIAALGLKQEELAQAERLGLGSLLAKYATSAAQLAAARSKAMEILNADPKFRQQLEMANTPGHPSQQQARAYVNQQIEREIGNIGLMQSLTQNAADDASYGGLSYAK